MRRPIPCSAPIGCQRPRAIFRFTCAPTGRKPKSWRAAGRRRRSRRSERSAGTREAHMSGLDIFAWIVLIVLAASAIGVFCIAGWLPGHVAKSRNHPYAQAVTVAGWITLLFGLALWPIALIWAYVDVPARRQQGTTP